ncbi:hypothetical protein CYY_003412 [Polysphondylium violaceum]|uniref:tRNA-binding domain-containing protein n=1 Tax=Polysphondylium violaceum TaxID=133409 RepID=A0A8J4V194_9MYCE|nr:hypothetical protein CYY_003412 [Polysphondylium violaceum]
MINNLLKSSSTLLTRSLQGTTSRYYGAACCGGKKPIIPAAPSEIELDDFLKIDLRVAKVIQAEHVDGAKKLLKLTLDVGIKQTPPAPTPSEPLPSSESTSTVVEATTEATTNATATTTEPIRDIRTVFSGIKAYYSPEQLTGKNVIYISNLKPRTMKFGVSQGMVLCASDEKGEKVLYTTTDDGSVPGMKVT